MYIFISSNWWSILNLKWTAWFLFFIHWIWNSNIVMKYMYVILFFFVCVSQIIQSTEEFENALKEMRFLKGDTTDLLKYARNINSHFANKKCQDVIVAARNLMTSEIHNTVKVSGLYCIVYEALYMRKRLILRCI